MWEYIFPPLFYFSTWYLILVSGSRDFYCVSLFLQHPEQRLAVTTTQRASGCLTWLGITIPMKQEVEQQRRWGWQTVTCDDTLTQWLFLYMAHKLRILWVLLLYRFVYLFMYNFLPCIWYAAHMCLVAMEIKGV